MTNGSLFAITRNQGIPYEMKPLRGKKLVYFNRNNYYRLKVVDEGVDDEDDEPYNDIDFADEPERYVFFLFFSLSFTTFLYVVVVC